MTYNTVLKLSALCLLGSWQMIHADAFLDVGGVFTTFNVPGAEPDSTVASSINNLGQIAGWFVNSSGITEGFVDTDGVFTTFAPPPSSPPHSPVLLMSQALTMAVRSSEMSITPFSRRDSCT
jgi:hypothetical protein